MTSPEPDKMEVDPDKPATDSEGKEAENLGLNALKRSNSAPMLATTASPVPIPQGSPLMSANLSFPSNTLSRPSDKTRRYSISSGGAVANLVGCFNTYSLNLAYKLFFLNILSTGRECVEIRDLCHIDI